ncbi:AraC family transcriptional regulator [Sphingobacterium bambusae]|uniref:AraC family transcriptional regulator n=1 Tax=Sphingobacterium bambusae TaxID=662858 RepID=A0ABW6BJ84_9SPHI|nr:AraC family transcriptional regulator [Sphingobacterium bambusae]WPL49488.1 AraC family transcriptional regulator [Sphingobacterium bambusae]
MLTKNLDTDLILLNAGYAEHYGDWNWKDLKSPIIRIHLVVKGAGVLERNSKSYVMRANHMYLTPSNLTQSYICDGELSLFYIHLYEPIEKQNLLFDFLEFPVEIESDDFILELFTRLICANPDRDLKTYDPSIYENGNELFQNIATQKSDSLANSLACKGIIQLILSKFAIKAIEKFPSEDPRVMEILKFIHHNCHKTIYLEQLADQVHMSKDHMIRIFKREIGVTPVEYINRKKIERSQMMLITSNITIKEISYSLGFESISYFNQIFKKHVGLTPLSFKKMITNKQVEE